MKARMLKAQMGIEFMLLTGISFIVLFVLLFVASGMFATANDNQKFQMVNDLGTSLQQEILVASTVEDGYSRVIYLPKKLKSTSYFVLIYNESTDMLLEFNYDQKQVYYPIVNIDGIITKGYHEIKKENGTVSINPMV